MPDLSGLAALVALDAEEATAADFRIAMAWQPAAQWLALANTPATRQSYLKSVRQFARLAGLAPAVITSAHVAAYKAHLVDEGLAPRTIRLRLSALRAFFEWAIDAGHHPGPNPVRGVPLPRVGGELAGRALTQDQVIALAAAAARTRDKALLWLLATGLRVCEAIALEQRDVHFEGTGVGLLVRNGKGGRTRQVPGGREVAEAIFAYVAETGRLTRSGAALGARVAVRSPLLQRLDGSGRALSYGNVYRVVTGAARRAGLGHLAPHDLRRTYITELLDLGLPLPAVQQRAGHALMEQTAHYWRPRAGCEGNMVLPSHEKELP